LPCIFRSTADLQALCERSRESGRADRRSRGLDVVVDPVPAPLPGLGVELEPGGAWVAVTGLADAARVEQPFALAQLDLGPPGGLTALRVAPAAAANADEEERDVGVADQPDPLLHRLEAGLRLVAGEHVLPDRVPGGRVEEPHSPLGPGGVEAGEVVEGLLADVLPRPLDRRCGALGEAGDVERAEHRKVVVAGQAGAAALAHQSGAGIRLGAVADHVAEAPDLVDGGLLDRREDGLEGLPVGVDVAEDGCAQGGSVPWPRPGPYDWPVTATDSIAGLRGAVEGAAQALWEGEPAEPQPTLERPPKPELGDYSSNAAMLLARHLSDNPRTVAERLRKGLEADPTLAPNLERIEVAGPGFVNFFLADSWYLRALGDLAEAGEGGLGPAPIAVPERVLVEFVSANPTGPIHVGTGRHAAYGDSLVRLLQAVGHDVQREYYINDAGSQIDRFAASITARMRGEEPPEDGYAGEYVTEIAARLRAEEVDPGDGAKVKARGIELMMGEIRRTLEQFGVEFDNWFSERSVYDKREVEAALAELEKRRHTYRSEDALWLRTTEFGDDKDRVLIRSNGEPTYLMPDIAYHWDKLQRGFDRLIDVLGADHHGYVARIRAAIEALGGDPAAFEALIMSLVHVIEEGERAQMSKRSGDFVTLEELLDDIGVDATRWFMLWRSYETTVDLDLELARSQSSENPVYYVQYAHARIASILRKAGEGGAPAVPAEGSRRPPLAEGEKALIKRLLEFPDEVRAAAARRAPHRICAYSTAVAADFHAFYRDCQVLGAEGDGIEASRLALCLATKRTIAAALGLLGISAPERM
jgi:arginyl-tRNA synthetase